MRSLAELKVRLGELGIEPKRALGQNFLINPGVIDRIVEAVGHRKFSEILEIGPGVGALTESLLVAGFKPRLLELDRELILYWRERGFEVIEGDALKLDWNSLQLPQSSLLVSNLPYQISTHLVIERCLGPENLKFMVLMFQKEVAQRLMAQPRTKEYGVLSVMAQLHYDLKKVADAAPQDFFPAPKIASRVLAFERREEVSPGLPFLKFVKAGFALRRKFLLKNLKAVVDKSKQGKALECLIGLGFTEKARAEELSPSDWLKLFKKIYEH